MKIMFASDIHGDYKCACETLDKYREEKAEKLILLGDILYHGPRNDLPKGYAPKKVIELLNSVKAELACVRGNCDTEVDQMVLDFPILADYAAITYNNTLIYATHGHIFNEENLPPLKKGDIILHGHTHIPACRVHEGYTYINPGSASIPKNGSHHGYMIFEDGVFTWKDFDGNIVDVFDINA